ncbi:hypothetical protein [Staphylococcus shinii]|uniref:hypothetical protein n=1 Tax=Staphylococcus shinii TaxID=2912228 RepID=UPI003CF96472
MKHKLWEYVCKNVEFIDIDKEKLIDRVVHFGHDTVNNSSECSKVLKTKYSYLYIRVRNQNYKRNRVIFLSVNKSVSEWDSDDKKLDNEIEQATDNYTGRPEFIDDVLLED